MTEEKVREIFEECFYRARNKGKDGPVNFDVERSKRLAHDFSDVLLETAYREKL